MDINILKQEILNRLSSLNPYKIILFGSYAWGEPDDDSDIDLYVVAKDKFTTQNNFSAV